jgi:hypothetical protein
MANKKKGSEDPPQKGPNWSRNQKNKIRRKASRQRKKEAKLTIGVIVLARTDIVRSPTPASLHDFGDPQSP